MINEHLYFCNILNEGNIIKDKYEYIFNENITEQKKFIDILEQNMKKYEQFTLVQEC